LPLAMRKARSFSKPHRPSPVKPARKSFKRNEKAAGGTGGFSA